MDSSRGAQIYLKIPATDNEVDSSGDLYTSFDSDGFTVGTDDVSNKNGDVYVAYCWKMNGGSETTNDASATGIGNEDSIHQANTTARQAIVKFQSTLTSDYGETGTPRTMAHGMGTKPDWVITRSRDGFYVHWNV